MMQKQQNDFIQIIDECFPHFIDSEIRWKILMAWTAWLHHAVAQDFDIEDYSVEAGNEVQTHQMVIATVGRFSQDLAQLLQEQSSERVIATVSRLIAYFDKDEINGGEIYFTPKDFASLDLRLAKETPAVSSALIRLIYSIHTGWEIPEDDALYLPWDSLGQASERSSGTWPWHENTYMETPFKTDYATKMKLGFNTPEVRFADPILDPWCKDGKLRMFDYTIAFLPDLEREYSYDELEFDKFNHRRFNLDKRSRRSTDALVLAIEHITAVTMKSAFIFVPSSFVNRRGEERGLLERLTKAGVLQSVTHLPEALTETPNGKAMLVLSKEFNSSTVRLSQLLEGDLDEDGSCHHIFFENLVCDLSAMKDESDTYSYNVVDVARAEFLKSRGGLSFDPRPKLNPNGVAAFYEITQYENYHTLTLGTWFWSVPPIQAERLVVVRPDSSDKLCEVKEMGFGDMRKIGFLREPRKRSNLLYTENLDERFLRPYDIVVAARGGSVGEVTIVPESVPDPGPGGWVAGSAFIVLRERNVKEPAVPRFFAYQLRTDIMSDMMKALAHRDSTVAILRKKALLEMPIVIGKEDSYLGTSFDDLIDGSFKCFQEQERLLCEIEKLESRAERIRNNWALARIQ